MKYDLKQWFAVSAEKLKTIYDDREAKNILKLLITERLGYTNSQFVTGINLEMDEAETAQLNTDLNRLMNFEPIQYILEFAEFNSITFKCTPAVLIPRPETEELIDWIIAENCLFENLKVLDIGTGSGCIAISLATDLTGAMVTAVDVSSEALQVARENAEQELAEIEFLELDILKASPAQLPSDLDIIVSNPPYVMESEKELMAKNVLEYEPQVAIFVPDQDPFLFYRKIASLALELLKPKGLLYFEINSAKSSEMKALLEEMGFESVLIKNDIHERARFIKALKP